MLCICSLTSSALDCAVTEMELADERKEMLYIIRVYLLSAVYYALLTGIVFNQKAGIRKGGLRVQDGPQDSLLCVNLISRFMKSASSFFLALSSFYRNGTPYFYLHNGLSVFSRSLSCSYHLCLFSQHLSTSLSLSPFPLLSLLLCLPVALLQGSPCFRGNVDYGTETPFLLLTFTSLLSHFLAFLLTSRSTRLVLLVFSLSSEHHFGVKSQRCSLC